MIQLKNIYLKLGSKIIFNGISVNFSEKQRIGVVGRNGAGKSTLLRVIAKSMPIDSGEISFEKGKNIAYMPQEVVINSQKSVFDEAFSVFEEFIILEKQKEDLDKLLSSGKCNDDIALEKYCDISEKLKQFDKSASIAKTQQILSGLGFNTDLKEKNVSGLSVGWKMRLILAKLLLSEADFYLFDEPTNHLDIVAKEWFFSFLDTANFGFLLVTHDRYYLDRGCDYILDLENGNATMYTGNYTRFLTEKEQRQQLLHVSYERQQKEIAKKQETIDRFRAKSSKARMAQSMIKQLEKIELIQIDTTPKNVNFTFMPMNQSGKHILSLKNLSCSFDGKTIFKNISGEIERGQKVALIAANGTGKTTLLNIIVDKIKPDTGSVNFGYNVKYAYFEQDQLLALDKNKTIIQEVLDATPNVTEAVIRSCLGSFLFSNDDIYKKISMLSGGERNRVAMVKVLLQGANFLILDEPTNHLDLYTKEILLKALQQYSGTILIVTHDHEFLNQLATNIFELTPNQLISYPGNYDSYLDFKKHKIGSKNNYNGEKEGHKPAIDSLQTKEDNFAQKELGKTESNRSNKDTFAAKKEIKAIENKISKLETELARINNLFENLTFGSPEYNQAIESLKIAQQKHAYLMEEWEKLLSQID